MDVVACGAKRHVNCVWPDLTIYRISLCAELRCDVSLRCTRRRFRYATFLSLLSLWLFTSRLNEYLLYLSIGYVVYLLG